MTKQLHEIWVYLAASLLLGLAVTLVACQVGYWCTANPSTIRW
jgi:ABC-type transporter Mla maintaining outer membrane lipid asymmetry permease subunit MlaE